MSPSLSLPGFAVKVLLVPQCQVYIVQLLRSFLRLKILVQISRNAYLRIRVSIRFLFRPVNLCFCNHGPVCGEILVESTRNLIEPCGFMSLPDPEST